jgi:hypothetical protein
VWGGAYIIFIGGVNSGDLKGHAVDGLPAAEILCDLYNDLLSVLEAVGEQNEHREREREREKDGAPAGMEPQPYS